MIANHNTLKIHLVCKLQTSSGFCFFVSLHINLRGLFKAKAILVEEQQWYYLTIAGERIKGVKTFPKVISLKIILTTKLEFELSYYNVAVQHASHYLTKAPPLDKLTSWN